MDFQQNEAAELAELFTELSEAVDDFRLDDRIRNTTARDQLVRLKFLGQKLDEQVRSFQADETVEMLELLQPDLGRIRTLAVEAKVRIALIEDAALVIAIAVGALSAGAAMAAGEPRQITTGMDELERAVAV